MYVRCKVVSLHHMVIKHEGYTLGAVCVSIDHVSPLKKNTCFVLPQPPNETLLLLQTMTSKLYSLEDEWLSYWSLVSPDSVLSKHRIATSFRPHRGRQGHTDNSEWQHKT